MAKTLVLMLIATAAMAIASRDVRSPGGSGWQTNSGSGGRSTASFGRSFGGGWAGSGDGLSRSSNNGGWRGTTSFGTSGRRRSGYGNKDPSSSGWSQSRYSSNDGYSGNSLRSSPGWNERFADSTVIESYDSSNSWDNPNLGRSNNGWQSSGW